MICENIGVNEAGHLTFAGLDTVELAKKYDDDKAPKFINGILNAVAEQKGLKAPKAAPASEATNEEAPKTEDGANE